MSLDVKIMVELDKLAELVSNEGDTKALSYINNVKLPADSPPYLRASYVKYYFQAKRDNKTKHDDSVEHPKGYGHGV